MAYVDILEGDAEGHIRFHSPEEARAVSDVRAELQKEHSWKLEILTGVNFISLFSLKPFVFCMDFITDDGENALSGHQASVFFNQRFDKTVKGVL